MIKIAGVKCLRALHRRPQSSPWQPRAVDSALSLNHCSDAAGGVQKHREERAFCLLWQMLLLPKIESSKKPTTCGICPESLLFHTQCPCSLVDHKQPDWTDGLFRDSHYVGGRWRRQEEPRELPSSLHSHPLLNLPKVTQTSDCGQKGGSSCAPLLPCICLDSPIPTFLARQMQSSNRLCFYHFASEMSGHGKFSFHLHGCSGPWKGNTEMSGVLVGGFW